jgi:agmatine/peptidylarginine deiminase
MIRDIDTNFVYLSDQLPQRFSDFFIRFTRLLDEMEIPWGLVPNTKDIWVRDFMPIQLSDGSFLQYIYTPDYLQEKKYLSLQSDPSVICQEMSLKCKKVDAVLDGGNITLCGDKIVLTNKIVAENHQEGNTLEFLAYLENVFGHEVIMIPWHCLNPEDDDADYFGHSDGFIHWCGGNKVLMSNYRDLDSDEAAEIRKILESHGFEVIEMLFDVKSPESNWNWAYINYLQVGRKIIMPAFRISEDQDALNYVQSANPDCEVRQISMRDIVNNGGALHCLTWNVKK